jgi:acyl carrier protein
MDEGLKNRVFDVIKREITVDPATVVPDQDLRDQINLDSMQFVSILARLEKEFDIEIPISAMEARTLDEFLAVLDNEMNKNAQPSR